MLYLELLKVIYLFFIEIRRIFLYSAHKRYYYYYGILSNFNLPNIWKFLKSTFARQASSILRRLSSLLLSKSSYVSCSTTHRSKTFTIHMCSWVTSMSSCVVCCGKRRSRLKRDMMEASLPMKQDLIQVCAPSKKRRVNTGYLTPLFIKLFHM